MDKVPRAEVLEAILAERERQDGMYGDQSQHTDEWWNVIATEENGEVARAIWDRDPEHMYTEIIQACAVYFAWAETILKRGRNEKHS